MIVITSVRQSLHCSRYRTKKKKKIKVFSIRFPVAPFDRVDVFFAIRVRNRGCKRNIHGTLSINDRVNRTSISGVKDSRKQCSTKQNGRIRLFDVKDEIIKNIHRFIRNNLGCLDDRTAEETYRLFIR